MNSSTQLFPGVAQLHGLFLRLAVYQEYKLFSFHDFLDVCTVMYELLLAVVGSAITGPIGKECADLWPRIASAANAIV